MIWRLLRLLPMSGMPWGNDADGGSEKLVQPADVKQHR